MAAASKHAVPEFGERGYQLGEEANLSLYERAKRWLFGTPENNTVTIHMRAIDAKACELLLGDHYPDIMGAPNSTERWTVEHLMYALGFAAIHGKATFKNPS